MGLYKNKMYLGEVKTISLLFVFPFVVKMIEIEMTLLTLFFSSMLIDGNVEDSRLG
jgi:hypothetical protein